VRCDKLGSVTKILLSCLAGAAMVSAQSVYLKYSSYLGGSTIDVIHAMTTDAAGNVYLTGATTSADFPVTAGAFQSKQAGSPGTMFGLLGPPSQADAFVVKLNPSGQVVYATYLGGALWDEGQAIAVDAQGSAYVLGVTDSNNFPTTAGALQATNATKFVGFLTKLSPDGSSLVYSTYLPGLTAYQGYAMGLDYVDVGQPSALAIDAEGNAYIGGAASAVNFPASAGAYKSSDGAFVAKVNANGTAYSFVTYLGGDRRM
jgi:Beta-propeller repeat